MLSDHFVSRDTWRQDGELPKGESDHPRSLDESFYAFPDDLCTDQKFICHNCHYEDFISDDAAFYYLVFGDFVHDEVPGFECPNCAGPMTTL